MMRSFLPLFRIEFRSLSRNWRRSLLIGMLLGVPLAATIAGSLLADITEPTDDERVVATLGNADLRITNVTAWRAVQERLPEGVQLEPISQGRDRVQSHGYQFSVTTRRQDLSGLAQGILRMVRGSAPVTATECAVTQPLLDACKIDVGDSLQLEAAGKLTVVGVFEQPEQLKELQVLFPFVATSYWGKVDLLVALPNSITPAEIAKKLDGRFAHFGDVQIRDDLRSGRSLSAVIVLLVGCFGLAEAALVIAAAFIVGLRRRQREIGLLASSGATQGHVVSSVLISALAISLITCIVATIVGCLVARGVHPYLDAWNHRRNGPFEIAGVPQAVILLLGIGTAAMAAVLPAISAARLPIKVALSARAPAPRSGGRWGALGAFLFLCGAMVVAVAHYLVGNQVGHDADNLAAWCIIFGSIIGAIGLGALSPWLLKCSVLFAGGLPLAWRLGVREVGRFRYRNGPIVTAILAGMSLSIVIGSLFQSVRNLDDSVTTVYQPDQLVVTGNAARVAAERISESLEGQSRARLELVKRGDRFLEVQPHPLGVPPGRIAIADGSLLKTLGIDDPQGKLLDALQGGSILSLDQPVEQTVRISSLANRQATIELPAIKPFKGSRKAGGIGYLVSRRTAQRFGWQTHSGIWGREAETWMIRLGEPVRASDMDQASELAAQFPTTTIESQLTYRMDRSQIGIVFLVSLVTGLVVVAIANALASEEGAR